MIAAQVDPVHPSLPPASSFHCEHCGTYLPVRGEMAGQQMVCPLCGEIGPVGPRGDSAPPPSSPPDQAGALRIRPNFHCENCGVYGKVRDELVGRRIKCPRCGQVGPVAGAMDLPEAPAGPTPAEASHPDRPNFHCQRCRVHLRVRKGLEGTAIKCPRCGAIGMVGLPKLEQVASLLRVAGAASAGPERGAAPSPPGGAAPAREASPRCPVCREAIQPGARKCKHCGEFLNDSGDVAEALARGPQAPAAPAPAAPRRGANLPAAAIKLAALGAALIAAMALGAWLFGGRAAPAPEARASHAPAAAVPAARTTTGTDDAPSPSAAADDVAVPVSPAPPPAPAAAPAVPPGPPALAAAAAPAATATPAPGPEDLIRELRKVLAGTEAKSTSGNVTRFLTASEWSEPWTVAVRKDGGASKATVSLPFRSASGDARVVPLRGKIRLDLVRRGDEWELAGVFRQAWFHGPSDNETAIPDEDRQLFRVAPGDPVFLHVQDALGRMRSK